MIPGCIHIKRLKNFEGLGIVRLAELVWKLPRNTRGSKSIQPKDVLLACAMHTKTA